MKKKDLIELIKKDKNNYSSSSFIKNIYNRITKQPNYMILKQVISSRKYTYYSSKKNNFFYKILFIYYSKKNNVLGLKNDIELYGKFGENLKIYHRNVVITKKAVIGNNVIIHGSNCIGINHNNLNHAPVIGNNVEIGYGATIIGNIEIADNIVIGANSLVNKSFKEEGIIIAGNPAKKIKSLEDAYEKKF